LGAHARAAHGNPRCLADTPLPRGDTPSSRRRWRRCGLFGLIATSASATRQVIVGDNHRQSWRSRTPCRRYGGKWKLIGEFTEVESGRNPNRPKLADALAMCRAYRAALVVANVSRLTRSVAFLSKLLEADDVEIRFADMPKIARTTTLWRCAALLLRCFRSEV
jgi:hypothetical protein